MVFSLVLFFWVSSVRVYFFLCIGIFIFLLISEEIIESFIFIFGGVKGVTERIVFFRAEGGVWLFLRV